MQASDIEKFELLTAGDMAAIKRAAKNAAPVCNTPTIKLISGSALTPVALTAAANGWQYNDVQIPAPGAFVGVRLLLANYDTAAVMPVSAVKVGGAAKHLSSSGNQIAWAAAKFSGSTSVNVPKATMGDYHIAPGIAISDLIVLSNVPRTDGGTRPLIRVRSLISGGASGLTVKAANYASVAITPWNADSAVNGYQLGSNTGPYDRVSNPADGYSVAESGQCQICVGAIFYTLSNIASMACFGDSIVQGIGSNAGGAGNGIMGWPARLTMADAGVCTANYATAGQKFADTRASLISYLSYHRPTYTAFKTWSPNDTAAGYYTQPVFDMAWAYTLDMVDQVQKAGSIPVLLTSGPVNGRSSDEVAAIKSHNARTLSLAGNGVVTVDVWSILEDPTNPGNLQPKYSFDGLHYTDAAYIEISKAVRAALGL